MATDPRIYTKEAGCQKERDALIKSQNDTARLELEALKQARARDGVFSGLNEILKIAYQPEAWIANEVAGGKDKITDIILGHMGGSRVMDVLLTQAAPAARDAVNNASQTILETLTGGLLDIDNLDDHADVYTAAAETMQNITDALGLSNSKGQDALRCGPLPYAMDLAEIGVKQKYLFVVEFVFSSQYQGSMGKLAHPFMVKMCDRPGIEFNYEEVNMYNYRTKVATRATYQPVNMTFYDDATSQVTSFYQQYVKAMSPIANVDTPQFFETEGQYSGMSFTHGNAASSHAPGAGASAAAGPGGTHTLSSKYGASVGVLTNGNGHINGRHVLQKINIYHLYRQRGLVFEDVYTLMNPRIVSAQLDGLSMAESDANETTFVIEYDSFYGQTMLDPTKGVSWASTKNITDLTSIAGKFPLNVTTPGSYGVLDKPAAGPVEEKIGRVVTGGVASAGTLVSGTPAGAVATTVEPYTASAATGTTTYTGSTKPPPPPGWDGGETGFDSATGKTVYFDKAGNPIRVDGS